MNTNEPLFDRNLVNDTKDSTDHLKRWAILRRVGKAMPAKLVPALARKLEYIKQNQQAQELLTKLAQKNVAKPLVGQMISVLRKRRNVLLANATSIDGNTRSVGSVPKSITSPRVEVPMAKAALDTHIDNVNLGDVSWHSIRRAYRLIAGYVKKTKVISGVFPTPDRRLVSVHATLFSDCLSGKHWKEYVATCRGLLRPVLLTREFWESRARKEELTDSSLAHLWLRPGDLADLPVRSMMYLQRVNKRLCRLAQIGSKLKYKRLVSRLLRTSNALNVWVVLRQLLKEGNKGLSYTPDLKHEDWQTLKELLHPGRSRMPSRLRRAIRNGNIGRAVRIACWKGKGHRGPYIAMKSYIPKPGTNDKRPLTFPAMIDRARETKILFCVLPQTLELTQPFSVGFWPNKDRIRGFMYAMSRALKAYGRGNFEILSVDIAKYFGSIPEEGRREMLSTLWIPRASKDYVVDSMIMPYLDTKDGKYQLWPIGKASSEGSVLLPLIANMYLFKFDDTMNALGVIYCRFADNLDFFLPRDGVNMDTFVEDYVQPLMPKGVTVHTMHRPDKTRILRKSKKDSKAGASLGCYVNGAANMINVILAYKEGEQPHGPPIHAPVNYNTPILDKFTDDWHHSFPTCPRPHHITTASFYLNENEELILGIHFDDGDDVYTSDPHDIAVTLATDCKVDVDEIKMRVDSAYDTNAQFSEALHNRIERAIRRWSYHYKNPMVNSPTEQKAILNKVWHDEMFGVRHIYNL